MLSPVLTPPAGTLLSQCCAEGALADAWAKVHENAGCPGVDGVSVEAFHQQALSRLAELRCAVQEGRYRPQPLLGVAIPKRSGGQRLLSIPTLTDRVLQTAVAHRSPTSPPPCPSMPSGPTGARSPPRGPRD